MHFIDRVDVLVKAGNGGNGVVSFRHEIYVDKGGPDGGDGGNGGNVVFKASRNENTLAVFRYKKEITAESGQSGGKRRKHGKSAKHLTVTVPVGTVVSDEKGNVLADLTVDGQEAVIAKGGRGGFGNAHFVSSTRQAPRIAEKGDPGDQLQAKLELKLIADVGLVGLPNAGKSTLLSVISNARPEIADYAFTTLSPNLGVVEMGKDTSALFADIPGLIEGAADGKGLGDEFLRHIERTSVLLHVIDAYQDDVAYAYNTIQKELAAYKIDLSDRPQVVALNKIEGLDKDIVDDLVRQLRAVVPAKTPLFAISAQAHKGLQELLYAVKDVLVAQKRQKAEVEAREEGDDVGLPVITLRGDEESWSVTREEGSYMVRGAKIERFAVRTEFSSMEGVARLRDIMKKMGIINELLRQGIQPGDLIVIADKGEFPY
jgi:GTPase